MLLNTALALNPVSIAAVEIGFCNAANPLGDNFGE